MRKNKFVSPLLEPSLQKSPYERKVSKSPKYVSNTMKENKIFFPINVCKQNNLEVSLKYRDNSQEREKPHKNSIVEPRQSEVVKEKVQVRSHKRQKYSKDKPAKEKGIQYFEKPLLKYNTIELKSIAYGQSISPVGKTIYRSKNIKSLGKLDHQHQNNKTAKVMNDSQEKRRGSKSFRTASVKKVKSNFDFYAAEFGTPKLFEPLSRDKNLQILNEKQIEKQKWPLSPQKLLRPQPSIEEQSILEEIIHSEVYGDFTLDFQQYS